MKGTQQQTLEDKVEAALECLRRVAQAHDPQRVFVAFTGGKDSTVALDLWRRALEKQAPLMALSLDTGCKFPEVLRTRDEIAGKLAVDLHVIQPLPAELDGLEPARDVVDCCRRLKIDPLNRALAEHSVEVLVTGLRRDEHQDRERLEPMEDRENPRHLRVHPLLEFTEMDVWAYLLTQGLPVCELYSQGYLSLGCMPCTSKSLGAHERAGRHREKEERMGVLRSLGYF